MKLKLIENDYSVLRKHDRRSSFAAFISVVVQRLLLDYRIAQWGKWHASAEAKRLGDRAIAIEAMLYRDGRTVDEVLPVVQRRWPEVTHAEIEDLTRRLPRRLPRPRAVPVDLAAEEVGADTESVHAAAFERDRIELAQRVNAIVRSVINEIGEHDRAVFRLHFDGGMSIAEIARTLHVEQKPLYRRVQRILAHLRSRLEAEGIGEAEANELLTARCTGLDLDLAGAVGPRRSSPEEGL